MTPLRLLIAVAPWLLTAACLSPSTFSANATTPTTPGDDRKAKVLTDINQIRDPGYRMSPTRDASPRKLLPAGDRIYFVARASTADQQERNCVCECTTLGPSHVVWPTEVDVSIGLEPIAASGEVCYYVESEPGVAPRLQRIHVTANAPNPVNLNASSIHGGAWVGEDVYVLYVEQGTGLLSLARIPDATPGSWTNVWQVQGTPRHRVVPVAGEPVVCFREDLGVHAMIRGNGTIEELPGDVSDALDTPEGLYLVLGGNEQLFLRNSPDNLTPVLGVGILTMVSLMELADTVIVESQDRIYCVEGKDATEVEVPWPYELLFVRAIGVLDGRARVLVQQVDPSGKILYAVHTIDSCQIVDSAAPADLTSVAGEAMTSDDYFAFVGMVSEDGQWWLITLDVGIDDVLTAHPIEVLNQLHSDFSAGAAVGPRSVFPARHLDRGLEPYEFPVFDK